MKPEFQVQLKIRRSAAEVFEAVVNPDKLSGYFVQSSSGPLAEGVTVIWSFAEAPEPFAVVVTELVTNELIRFGWPAEDGGYNTQVEMNFEPIDAANTMVRIRESGWKETPGGIKASYGNAGGWMHMMCCLKAYLEYGINLRAGGAL
jgi:uncharacterized protein YndB with AHSA1/START domain